jgi:alkanesulfonate monooxygenase SsuD/methylene tetrahydromethanopterin reductase-like flavin-dependent oxidoreductase (luciferase family)
MATLDYLSGGRLIFGVGVGEKYLRPQEYAIANVPIEQRGAITDEYLGLMQRLWTEPSVTHHGKFFQCTDITIEPKPVRQAKIPIWIGGKAEEPLLRTAAYADGWMPALITPSDYSALWSRLSEHVAGAARDMSSITGAVYVFAAIGASYEAARSVLAPGIEAIFHAPFQHFEPVCLVGTADQWVEQIGRVAAVGVTHVNVLLYTHDLIGDVEWIGQEVVPRV